MHGGQSRSAAIKEGRGGITRPRLPAARLTARSSASQVFLEAKGPRVKLRLGRAKSPARTKAVSIWDWLTCKPSEQV